MIYVPTATGFVRPKDSLRILKAIFPNYPNLNPCLPAPKMEKAVEWRRN